MDSKNTKKEVIVIGDDMINRAIMAIESTEPTPEEVEAEQLNKLIPFIRAAINRGESRDKISIKIRSAIRKLHHKKIKALLDSATGPVCDQRELADQTDHLLEGAQ